MRTSQFTVNEVIQSFARNRVLSKADLLQKHGCSCMTLWRLLRQVGYLTSYNYNAKYYTLTTIPEFDDYGLWSFRDIRFSKWGTLPETMIGVIERSAGGMTAREVADLLHVGNTKPLLGQLAAKKRLRRETLGSSFVYLASECAQREQQQRRRNEQVLLRALPDPEQIIALLVQVIRHPQQEPRHWARQLARRDIHLDTQEIKAVLAHYGLSPKKGL